MPPGPERHWHFPSLCPVGFGPTDLAEVRDRPRVAGLWVTSLTRAVLRESGAGPRPHPPSSGLEGVGSPHGGPLFPLRPPGKSWHAILPRRTSQRELPPSLLPSGDPSNAASSRFLLRYHGQPQNDPRTASSPFDLLDFSALWLTWTWPALPSRDGTGSLWPRNPGVLHDPLLSLVSWESTFSSLCHLPFIAYSLRWA